MSKLYFYQLLEPSGRVKIGLEKIPVEKKSSARDWLEKKYEHAIVVRLEVLPSWIAGFGNSALKTFKGTVKQSDLVGLIRDLAIMTISGIPIVDAVQSRIEDGVDDSNPQVIALCKQLYDDLTSGSPLSFAVAKYPDIFPATAISLIKIGEESGNLSEMLLEASTHMERLIALRADAKQALIYPAVSLLAVIGAGIFWMIYVMPNLIQLFKQLNAKLPPFTVKVLAAAEWLDAYGKFLLVFIIVFIISAIVIWRTRPGLRRAVYIAMHHLPVIKNFLVASGIAFFAEYFGILIKSGVDILTSLKILEDAQPDVYYSERIQKIHKHVATGMQVSVAMRQIGGFPSMLVRMIAIGENSGNLDKQLAHVSKEYGVRLKRLVDTLSEIIKPVMILMVGSVFLVIIVALMLPVYDLIAQSSAVR
jgi:type II secretory pathway component PulF